MRKRIRRNLSELKNQDLSADEWNEFIETVYFNLGSFIITFNELDQTLTDSLIDLLEPKNDKEIEIQYVLIGNKQVSEKVNDLENIISIINKGLNERKISNDLITSVFDEIRELNTIRNEYVHGDWYDTEIENNKILIRFKTKVGKHEPHFKYFIGSPEEIEKNEDRVENAIEKVEKIIEALKR
jgi:hypothetical protein